MRSKVESAQPLTIQLILDRGKLKERVSKRIDRIYRIFDRFDDILKRLGLKENCAKYFASNNAIYTTSPTLLFVDLSKRIEIAFTRLYNKFIISQHRHRSNR